MLNLSDPMTRHIFRAAGLMDGVQLRGHTMSVSPSAARTALLAECLPFFAGMRELARDRFGERAAFLLAAVDEYEAAIRTLAGLGDGRITEDRRNGAGPCSACSSPLTKVGRRVYVCGACVKPFMAAYLKLDSTEGFRTWAI